MNTFHTMYLIPRLYTNHLCLRKTNMGSHLHNARTYIKEISVEFRIEQNVEEPLEAF